MFGLKRVKPRYTVGLRFYPLYKGQPENKMEHRECLSVRRERGLITIVRADNVVYTYPEKDVMAMSVRVTA